MPPIAMLVKRKTETSLDYSKCGVAYASSELIDTAGPCCDVSEPPQSRLESGSEEPPHRKLSKRRSKRPHKKREPKDLKRHSSS